MAAIALARATPWGVAYSSPNKRMRGPIAATQTMVPGDVLKVGSGALTVDNAVAAQTLAGISEQAGSSLATSTLVNYTMVLPADLWEISGGVVASSGLAGISTITGFLGTIADIGDNAIGVVINVDSSHQLRLVGLASWMSQMEAYRFIGDNATSETAGATTVPDAATKGGLSDTQQRIVCTFDANFILWMA